MVVRKMPNMTKFGHKMIIVAQIKVNNHQKVIRTLRKVCAMLDAQFYSYDIVLIMIIHRSQNERSLLLECGEFMNSS